MTMPCAGADDYAGHGLIRDAPANVASQCLPWAVQAHSTSPDGVTLLSHLFQQLCLDPSAKQTLGLATRGIESTRHLMS